MNSIGYNSIAQRAPNYYEINREERNYTAILFSALCKPGNTERFLKHCCGFDGNLNSEDLGVYLEYAYLRDLWNEIGDKPEAQSIKKEIIRQHLKINGIDEILSLDPVDINRKFGVRGTPSKDVVQFPGGWAIVHYDKNFTDNEDFLKICKFKWSFNIKPDIVIHLDKNRAICIEAKYESKEGSYPTSSNEKAIFEKRKIRDGYVEQIELQEYMMKELLGIETYHMILTNNASKSSNIVTWEKAFAALDMKDMPFFSVKMANKISLDKKGRRLG